MHKILVVEDEKDLITLIERKCQDLDIEVIPALDGTEAFQQFKEQKPELVLVDVVLPDIDGFELCRQIKQELDPNVKIIAYTGKLEQVDVELARRSGADELILKSGNLDTIIETIQKFLK